MAKVLMPKWFLPALLVTGAVAVVSGLRVLKDSRLFGGDETEIAGEDEEEPRETVVANSPPDEQWMDEVIWEIPTGDGLA
jgi:hypothetical protein